MAEKIIVNSVTRDIGWTLFTLLIFHYKMTGVVDWSWWTTVGVMLLPALLIMVIMAIAFVVIGINDQYKLLKLKQRANKRRQDEADVRASLRDQADRFGEM